MHPNHVDIVPQLRYLLADRHDLVKRPHALPGLEVRQVLVHLLEPGVQILHCPVVANDGVSITTSARSRGELIYAAEHFVLPAMEVSHLRPKVVVRQNGIPLRPNNDAGRRLWVESAGHGVLFYMPALHSHRTA